MLKGAPQPAANRLCGRQDMVHDEVLALDGVSRRYGSLTVFRNVSLSVPRGLCVALTGRNGSGKSTLLKIAGGLTRASSGRVRRRRGASVQLVPENFPRPNVSARRLLYGFGRLEGLGGGELRRRVGELLEDFSLAGEADAPLMDFSKGMLQKVSVIQAMLRKPDLLLLDEPLSGQDARSQRVFIRRVRGLLNGGSAVLLACHEPFLMAALAQQAYEVGPEGLTPREAETGAPSGRDVYRFLAPSGAFSLPDPLGESALLIRREDGALTVAVRAGEGNELLKALLSLGCRLTEMRHEESL